jgi:Icc protein
MINRETFASVSGETDLDRNGFVQWTEETPAGLFVYMDTVDQGRHGGLYCAARMAWLAGVLDDARASGNRAFLFMHHNPVRVNVANADIIGIVNQSDLQALLKRYNDVIAHIFFGHCHYSLSGAVAGISYSPHGRPTMPAGRIFREGQPHGPWRARAQLQCLLSRRRWHCGSHD